MTACETTKKRLSAYLDGEVTPVERGRIEAHLAGCAGCRTLREELARSTQVLANAPEPHWAPDSTDQLIGRLRVQLARERPAAPPAHVMAGQVAAARGGYNWRALALPLAAVVLVVAVPGLWMSGARLSDVRSAKQAPVAADAVVADARKSEAARVAVREPGALAPEPKAMRAAPVVAPAEMQAAPAEVAQGKEESGGFGDAGAVARQKDRTAAGAPSGQLAKVAEPARADAGLAGAVAPGPAARPARARALDPASTLAAARATSAPAASPASLAANLQLGAKAAEVAAPVPTPLTPASGVLSALDVEIAALEARMAKVEAEVSAFTTAARQDAQRESSQWASRRFATWR